MSSSRQSCARGGIKSLQRGTMQIGKRGLLQRKERKQTGTIKAWGGGSGVLNATRGGGEPQSVLEGRGGVARDTD